MINASAFTQLRGRRNLRLQLLQERLRARQRDLAVPVRWRLDVHPDDRTQLIGVASFADVFRIRRGDRRASPLGQQRDLHRGKLVSMSIDELAYDALRQRLTSIRALRPSMIPPRVADRVRGYS